MRGVAVWSARAATCSGVSAMRKTATSSTLAVAYDAPSPVQAPIVNGIAGSRSRGRASVRDASGLPST